MNLGELIDLVVSVRAQKTALTSQLKTLIQEEARLEGLLMIAMNEVGTLKASSGMGHSVSMQQKTYPAVIDWQKFYDYVAENDRFDLLQRRLSVPAFNDMWAAGDSIPGTTSSTVWEIKTTATRA